MNGEHSTAVSELGREPEKQARIQDSSCDAFPEIPASASEPEAVAALRQAMDFLQRRPFGVRAVDCEWGIKRSIFDLLPRVVEVAESGPKARAAAAALVDQLVRSGYAQTVLDRRTLVTAGAWRPLLAVLTSEDGTPADKATAVYLYIYMAEHVNFYEDFAGSHPDYWNPEVFLPVLRHMPTVVLNIPDELEAAQWEMICPEIESALKCLGSYMLFWGSGGGKLTLDLAEVLPLLDGVLRVVEKFDAILGGQISAKNRGDPLEELTRLSGVLAQYLLSKIEECRGDRPADLRRQAGLLLGFLVRLLMLRIPTCSPRAESAPSSSSMPVDERQQDTDWIEGLWENCDGLGEESVSPATLVKLFGIMVTMPLEEQRYRLECIAPLVSAFVAGHADQLRQKVVPAELAELKIVMNAVLQDDATVTNDLLEEISFFPCLLDFATKRATIHAVCERVRLQSSAGEPIRLVVPRDNVLDGVCDSLNLRDTGARVDVPLEIEFRAGYSDDNGNEALDEGEDQGGLRRQWLDRASRHFIASDLFMVPSEDAAHLAGVPGLPTERMGRGQIFVPQPESVCRCVQDDWEEQFELFGCVLGFAILYKETLPVHFGHNFLRSVFGLKTDAQDLLPLLENVDKMLHTKLKHILDGGYKELGETLEEVLEQSRLPRVFAVSESKNPELTNPILLTENGDQIPVTEERKEEFVQLFLDRVLVSGLARQVECFRRGLLRVVPLEVVQRIAELMSVKEIELMVCGADEVDVSDWEKHTQYENGYTNESQPVRWFWETVQSMSQPARAALLSFATGSSQVPSGGFRFLQPELFTIQRVAAIDRCPEAHTCANMVDLPEYTSREELQRRLRFAIEETGDAFGRR